MYMVSNSFLQSPFEAIQNRLGITMTIIIYVFDSLRRMFSRLTSK